MQNPDPFPQKPPQNTTKKSTVKEIKERFDKEVERFSNLETGQSATVDAPLVMELITSAAINSTSPITRVLDIGCGAGNNTIKLRQSLGHDFTADLLDISTPMVDRAHQRVSGINAGIVNALVGDFRTIELKDNTYDIVLAAAVLHHLRDDADWESVFKKLFSILRVGGSVWISDLVTHEHTAVNALMWKRYGTYLESLGGASYRDDVFAYIEKEDSPRSLTYQLNLLYKVGFSSVDVLHKHSCFAAFGAIKE